MPQGQLAQVLRGVIGEEDERLLVGPTTVDDAGVVSLGPAAGFAELQDLALVQTVDYFPPVVDDPYFYGAIAAANSLSDVYAMGGRPYTALNLAGFPKDFPSDWMHEIFRGGFDKVKESGAVVAGGHTVQSDEVLFGFAITGFVDRKLVSANAGAQVGDVLYLTKSLGMGTLTTAAKRSKITWAEMEPAAEQMALLNARAAEAMNAVGSHAATDITGFGLAGHAKNIAAASGVTLRFDTTELPIFPGALELARAGFMSGGSARGRAALAGEVVTAEGLDDTLAKLVFDAETSGGLLIAVAEQKAAALERELEARDQLVRAVGRAITRTAAWVEFA
jgi:selenide,water dikinase